MPAEKQQRLLRVETQQFRPSAERCLILIVPVGDDMQCRIEMRKITLSTKLKPYGYTPGEGTGFLPGEAFPG